MVEILTTESDYIKGKWCYEKNIRHLKIVSEGGYVDSKDFNQNPVRKLEIGVAVEDAGTIKNKKWQPNNKALGVLTKLFGKDSKNWVNKKLKINLSPYKDTYSIEVDEMDTRALNQPTGL